jgi:hypothetical protein
MSLLSPSRAKTQRRKGMLSAFVSLREISLFVPLCDSWLGFLNANLSQDNPVII